MNFSTGFKHLHFLLEHNSNLYDFICFFSNFYPLLIKIVTQNHKKNTLFYGVFYGRKGVIKNICECEYVKGYLKKALEMRISNYLNKKIVFPSTILI